MAQYLDKSYMHLYFSLSMLLYTFPLYVVDNFDIPNSFLATKLKGSHLLMEFVVVVIP